MKGYRFYTNITHWLAGGLLMLTVTATGCSDENRDIPGTDEMVPLNIKEVKGSTWAEGATRATTEDVETSKLPQTLLVLKEGDASSRKTYTLSGGKWTSDDPLMVGTPATKVYALGGVPEDKISDSKFQLSPRLYEDDTPIPYYSESQNLSAKNSNATFEMKHFYARLTIQLKKDANCIWDGKMKSIYIYDFNIYNYNMSDRTYEYLTDSPVFKEYSPELIVKTNSYTGVLDVLIAACDGQQPSNHRMTLGNSSSSSNHIFIEGTLNYTPRAGEWTTLRLTVKPGEIVFDDSESVKITDFWDNNDRVELELKD